MKELAAWYQKKMSSYDKAEWERLVERLLARGAYRPRIVDFSTHVRSYLIDVDLVRGSSFPKAKATLGVRRVAWLALLRLLLLPGLFRWWRQQTSPTCARLLLALWLLQLANLAVYVLAPLPADVECDSVLVPLGLMVALSLVHAQIVSTTALELGRVRPRHASRRKLPSYVKRAQRACSGGSPGSAESETKPACGGGGGGAGVGGKPSKFRRRASLARGKTDDKQDEGLRKRKKTLDKPTMTKDPPNLVRPAKVKDSDDEDYMDWKRPASSNPTVTFTPTTEDKARNDIPYLLKPKVLTRKHLEKLNRAGKEDVRKQNIARISSGDKDDGFESFNGNYSNGSDNESRLRMCNKHPNIFNVKDSIEIKGYVLSSEPNIDDAIINDNDASEGSAKSGKIFMKIDEKLKQAKKNRKDKVCTLKDNKFITDHKNEVIGRVGNNGKGLGEFEANTDKSEDSPGKGKRPGVRFRNSWVQEMIEHETSDIGSSNKKAKDKNSEEFQTSSSEGECETASAPSIGLPSHQTMSDWVCQTSNSEECSYSSQSEGSQSEVGLDCADSTWDPFSILNPASDTVKCTMWEEGAVLRARLSAVDISWCVVARAERATAADGGYLWAGVAMAAAVAAVAPAARLLQVALVENAKVPEESQASLLGLPWLLVRRTGASPRALLSIAFGDNPWVLMMNVTSCFLRLALAGLCFFLLAVAERAYKQRFLYAKLFSHLTSARRARKSQLPHFRLHTVRNIKTWLSARSYLRRRGPQRSVDVIVSAAFVATLSLLACVAAQLLRESATVECGWLLEVMVWCCCLGVYLLRLLTLGSNVNRKYRGCLSAIITEQINLHLAMEQRVGSKEELGLANNVLKLAADLLKELDVPFKISGICANHYLYTITKVVILSALSGVLSEMLGFKLKLDKIKIK